MDKTVDIVLITYGEPTENSFLEQWKYSNRILSRLTRRVAPIPRIAVPFLGAYRAYAKQRTWRTNRYTSRMGSITERQKQSLQERIHKLLPDLGCRVHTACQFRDPTLLNRLTEICRSGRNCVLLVPMYVARSDFTTGLLLEDRNCFQEKVRPRRVVCDILHLSDYREKLAAVMASFVERELSRLDIDPDRCEGRGLLLAAHGTLTSPSRNIRETGYEETSALGELLRERLSRYFQRTSLAWLNHRRGGVWTSPAFQEAAKEMLRSGIRHLVCFPFGFLTDNEESELTTKIILRRLGVKSYTHLECLNVDEEFMDFLAEAISEKCKAMCDPGGLGSSFAADARARM